MMYNLNKINYIPVEERRHKVHMLQMNNVIVFPTYKHLRMSKQMTIKHNKM